LIITAVLLTPVYCQALGVALLLQQSPAQGGTIIPGPGVHDFALNSEVTLTAIPKRGYHFVCWLGDVADPTSNTTIALLNKPKIIIAVFEQNEYNTLSVEANTPGGAGGGAVAIVHRSPPLYNPFKKYIPEPPLEPPEPPEPPIPEPATALLLALGSPALLMRRRSA
jgi:hypothetical protein